MGDGKSHLVLALNLFVGEFSVLNPPQFSHFYPVSLFAERGVAALMGAYALASSPTCLQVRTAWPFVHFLGLLAS